MLQASQLTKPKGLKAGCLKIMRTLFKLNSLPLHILVQAVITVQKWMGQLKLPQ